MTARRSAKASCGQRQRAQRSRHHADLTSKHAICKRDACRYVWSTQTCFSDCTSRVTLTAS
jgi:hypothetical protein